MITGGQNRFLTMAVDLCKKSTHPQHKMSAIVVKGGAVLSKACNLHHWTKHAESRALRPHLDLSGATVYIARGNRGCSRPCADCMLAIIDAGVKAIVFFDRNNEPTWERI